MTEARTGHVPNETAPISTMDTSHLLEKVFDGMNPATNERGNKKAKRNLGDGTVVEISLETKENSYFVVVNNRDERTSVRYGHDAKGLSSLAIEGFSVKAGGFPISDLRISIDNGNQGAQNDPRFKQKAAQEFVEWTEQLLAGNKLVPPPLTVG